MLKKLREHIIFGLLRAVAALPFWALYRLADLTFLLLYYIIRYRRRVVRANLDESFPEMTPAERRRIARRFYLNFADYIFETIKLLHISNRQIMKRMTFEDVDNINNFVAEGRSVAVYFSHCGNWEWGTSITLHSVPPVNEGVLYAQVYRPLRDKFMDSLMLRIRSRFGSLSFTKNTVFRDIIRERRRTGLPIVVGFMSDQHPSHGDLIHVVDFLNHPTAFITGTETLARKIDMGVIYWDMTKPRRGHYHIVCRLMTADITAEPQFSITDRYAAMLEQTIRRDPALWLWTHKRWKNRVTFEDNEQPRH